MLFLVKQIIIGLYDCVFHVIFYYFKHYVYFYTVVFCRSLFVLLSFFLP